MKIFADASAIVAIIAGEADADSLTTKLGQSAERLYSAMSKWEAAAAIARIFGAPPAIARGRVESFIAETGMQFVPIGEAEAAIALDAFAAYGKGHHKASLNMGDCFAYACAKANGAKLLYKGDDFAQTDMA